MATTKEFPSEFLGWVGLFALFTFGLIFPSLVLLSQGFSHLLAFLQVSVNPVRIQFEWRIQFKISWRPKGTTTKNVVIITFTIERDKQEKRPQLGCIWCNRNNLLKHLLLTSWYFLQQELSSFIISCLERIESVV